MGSDSAAGSSSYAGSATSSKSSASRRARADHEHQDGQGEDLLERRSTIENGVFGVLFTLCKESGEAHIHIRGVLLKLLLDAWQLFTTVISPAEQGWRINADGTAWAIVGVLNFTWLSSLGYSAYLAVLYSTMALLAINVIICVWVAWCFKERKFPVVWPIKVLRVFSSVFFQAFDVASLNLLQLGISCRYTGPVKPHLHFNLFPEYSCSSTPHIMHLIVSALCLVLFVGIALLINMAEVEVNLLSRRPLALGHSGAEVMAFAIKVLLTLVNVFIGWKRVAACVYLALSLAMAWQYLRWSPNIVAWVNYLKSGVAITIVWCSTALMLLVFRPGVKEGDKDIWAGIMTIAMLFGLAPAFGIGALMSWYLIRHKTKTALKALANAMPEAPLNDICQNIDDPRDVEVVARCCRVWKDRYTLDPSAVNKAHKVIQAGMAMFPGSAYMVLLQGNFMIDVLGVSQSGGRRIEDARKLDPGLMCRFIMFVRQQQATQHDAGTSANNGGGSMDLLAYVEYQRKQRMVVRLHREALQAMCNFWKALDASRVSFTHLSKALGRIESSVSQAQTAYRVVLENYGRNPKLVRLYGKFLQTIKNDPWRASEYFMEADRLEEVQSGDAGGPLLPDGTPLGRMDEISTAVLVINSTGEMQVANRHAHILFGYKRGMLEGKPLSMLLVQHFSRRVSEKLAALVSTSALAFTSAAGADGNSRHFNDEVVVGMHYDRLAFPVKLSLCKASGVGEDSTFIVVLEAVPPVRGVASLWVSPNGTIVACDPQFIMTFGWKSSDINGAGITGLMSVQQPGAQAINGDDSEVAATAVQHGESASDMLKRLIANARAAAHNSTDDQGLQCLVTHKYDTEPVACNIKLIDTADAVDTPVHEIRFKLPTADPVQLLVLNRKGTILYASTNLAACLKDAGGPTLGVLSAAAAGTYSMGPTNDAALGSGVLAGELLSEFHLSDFLPAPWKDMHQKFLKSTTALSPPGHSPWSCRKASKPGPTLELRSLGGKPIFMHVSATTADVAGELNHVVHIARSSLETALTERRLRLQLSEEGLITALGSESSTQLFGLEPNQLIGRGFWDVINWSSHSEVGSLPNSGPLMFSSLINRALTHPGYSWRVLVTPPPKAAAGGGALDLFAAARATLAKQATMQVYVELPTNEADVDEVPSVYIDLWPAENLTGVLELDPVGRIRSVLEEHTRPAGLLFGVPTQSLMGSVLGELLELPRGRSIPGELLSLHGAKKSSLKTSNADAHVKVGAVHVLKGAHTDGLPNSLDIQIVGKLGPKQITHAILRPHVTPMMPPRTVTAAVDGPPAAVLTTASTLAASAQMKATHSQALAMAATTTAATLTQRPPSIQPTRNLPGVAILQRSDDPDVLEEDAAVTILPTPPELLDNGLPVPGLITAVHTGIGQSKLADLVRSMGSPKASAARDRLLASVDGSTARAGNNKGLSSRTTSGVPPLLSTSPLGSRVTSDVPLALPASATTAAGGLPKHMDVLLDASKNDAPDPQPGLDIQSIVGSDDDNDTGTHKPSKGETRISTWVASQGAYYQNTIGAGQKSDDEGSKRSDDLSGAVPADMKSILRGDAGTRTAGKDTRFEASTPESSGIHTRDAIAIPDDDAASEGGQSAMSAQSANSGAEYKRGKRFRKLVKLMDSSQTQQVQQRFRTHALATMAVLAVVHTACFILTVTAVKSKRGSMLQLGRSGQSQRYMHQILTDVRSLDVISRNKTQFHLYTNDDAKFFVARIATGADEIQVRLKEILDAHQSSSSSVKELFFYSQRKVWDGNNIDGSDKWTNLTIWDFASRFYTMAKDIQQNYFEWQKGNVHIADTHAGQFLIKSGPDLWKASRQILDALLMTAVDSARYVETLQLVFLVVEGAAITLVAACYLAYLLQALSAQRYKLYSTFLVIPVGLTRVLASQNTTLLVDEEEDTDDDDGEDGRVAPTVDDEDEAVNASAAIPPKQKRRAMLNVSQKDCSYEDAGDLNVIRKPGRNGSSGNAARSTVGDGNPPVQSRMDMLRAQSNTLSTSRSLKTNGLDAGCWSWLMWRLRHPFARRPRGVAPLPQSMIDSGGISFTGGAKRKLKYDSHETIMVLLPFVVWSTLVIVIYVLAVAKIKGIVEVVAVHSVANFMSARTYRAVFFGQELAVVEDPALLAPRRAALLGVLKVVKDAWYTLQLGANAYKALGPGTERFPLVKDGLAYASPELADAFYGLGKCHRVAGSPPCPGPDYRFYYIVHSGLDNMMNQFLLNIEAMATNTSMVPVALAGEHIDFIYNVGSKDLIDGTIEIQIAHYDTILARFDGILVLHVILFLMFWVIFAGFLFLLLNPLLKRVTRERRRIAELISQLPLELDVERLVARALGNVNNTSKVGTAPGGHGVSGTAASVGDTAIEAGAESHEGADGVNKWKAIIRSFNTQIGPNKMQSGDLDSKRLPPSALPSLH